MLEGKKVLYSGMQATGDLTIGNYLGALKNWVALSDKYMTFYAVADLHSLTIREDPRKFKENAFKLYTVFIASGIDPEKNCIYFQSQVKQHAELAWILDCFTYMGELSRMTQFKDKSSKHSDNVNAGLFTYPCLMAADILLYQTDLVPVGIDQKQHLEITRTIAERLNSIYGDIFTVPDIYLGESAAKVMSLKDPSKKMSKSDVNPNATVYIMDDKDTIMRKFKRAVTDSVGEINYTDDQPGIKNLIDIYCSAMGKSTGEALKEFEGKGYGELKIAVGEAVSDTLKPLHEKYDELSKNRDYVNKAIKDNAKKAAYYAEKTMRKLRKKLGLNT